MDLGSDTPDPAIYPTGGLTVEVKSDHNFNTNTTDIRYVATCAWCDLEADRLFRVVDPLKQKVVAAWENHARIFHPARLDPKFNARTVG